MAISRKFDASKNMKMNTFMKIEDKSIVCISSSPFGANITSDNLNKVFIPTYEGYTFRTHDMKDDIAGISDEILGDKVLICPNCKIPVEPDFPLYQKPKGKVVLVLDADFWKRPLFCFCKKCSTSFFICEIIKQMSWRKLFSTEEDAKMFNMVF